MSDFDDDDPRDEAAPQGEDHDADANGASVPPSGSGDKDAKGRPADDDDWDDDWDDDDDRGGGRRDLTMIFAIVAAVAVIALVIILTRPDNKDDSSATGSSTTPGQTQDSSGTTAPGGFCANWPGAVGGDKKLTPKADTVRVWSDFDGWHIRSARKDVVAVKVTSPGNVKITDKGNATASAEAGKDLTITLPAGDGSAGPNLDLPCESTSVTLTFTAAGASLPADSIQVGDTGKADNNPVTFTRGEP